MYCKISLLLTLALASTSIAQREGGPRGVGGPPGEDMGGLGGQGFGEGHEGAFGGHGPGEQAGFGGLGGKGGHRGGAGRGPGGKRGHLNVTLVNITCSVEEYGCALPNGEDGFFVCRGLHDARTGEENFEALCIEKDKAWENVDECGCCGEECPEQPDFIDITCDSIPGDFEIPNNRHDDADEIDLAVVCRDVFNPFTGEPAEVTVPIPANRALEGDSCGCCDGTCPEKGDTPFEKPEPVEKSCIADELITCSLPRRGGGRGHKGGDDGEDIEEEEEGFFVCRQTFDLLAGETIEEATCITEDSAWDGDICGCCGDECPEDKRDSHVEIECLGEDMSCNLPRGEPGVYVCRSSFNVLDGSPEKTSLCIPTHKAWEGNDVCGCCEETGCPESRDFDEFHGGHGQGGPQGPPDDSWSLENTSFELAEGEDGAFSFAIGLGWTMVAFTIGMLV